jgi:hypothetical protein
MSSLTLKPKKLKRKDKDSCKTRKFKTKRKIKNLDELPLTPFEILVLSHVNWWVNKNTRDGIAPLKGTDDIYTYQTMKKMTEYLKQKDSEASMSKVQRALKRLHEVRVLKSGFYAPKRYEKHGGKLSRLQSRQKSYVTTAKGRKILEQLEHAKRQKKRDKCISINNKISDNSHLLKTAFKKGNSAAQGSSLKILRMKSQDGLEFDEKDKAYFDKRMGRHIPKLEKDRLWGQMCEHNKKLHKLKHQITDPIAWAYFMYWTNTEERNKKANEQYAKSKEVEDRLLAKERMLRGRGGSDCNFAEGCENVMYNAQVKMNYGPMDQEQTYVPIKKQTPPKPVCEYYEGYSVAINNMIPMIRSGDETSIDAMVSCECWCLEDIEVARGLCKQIG